MPETFYAVHTQTVTYLLDEEGVCRFIVSPTGVEPPDVRLCVGAQFVACLDVREGGGLVGELRLGATALFVRRDAGGRKVLLRTRRIEHVESRKDPAAARQKLAFDDRATVEAPASSRPKRAARRLEEDDDDDLARTNEHRGARRDGEEYTVTLTMPLYRPDSEPPPRRPPASWRPGPPPAPKSRGRKR